MYVQKICSKKVLTNKCLHYIIQIQTNVWNIHSQEDIFMKKKILAFIITAFAALSIVITVNIIKADGAGQKLHEHKYFVSIQVEADDTLWSIADKYMTEEYASKSEYISEVKSINNMSGDTIHAGSYIVVPVYSND